MFLTLEPWNFFYWGQECADEEINPVGQVIKPIVVL